MTSGGGDGGRDNSETKEWRSASRAFTERNECSNAWRRIGRGWRRRTGRRNRTGKRRKGVESYLKGKSRIP